MLQWLRRISCQVNNGHMPPSQWDRILRNKFNFKSHQIDLIYRELTLNTITSIAFGIITAVRVSLALAD